MDARLEPVPCIISGKTNQAKVTVLNFFFSSFQCDSLKAECFSQALSIHTQTLKSHGPEVQERTAMIGLKFRIYSRIKLRGMRNGQLN